MRRALEGVSGAFDVRAKARPEAVIGWDPHRAGADGDVVCPCDVLEFRFNRCGPPTAWPPAQVRTVEGCPGAACACVADDRRAGC